MVSEYPATTVSGEGIALFASRLPEEIGYAFPLSFATLGTAVYDPLAADLKAAVDRAASTTQAQQWTRLATRLEENYAWLRANKVMITTADKVSPALRSALVSAAATAVEAWKRDVGPEASALLR